jgi:hypothetical protein
MSIPWYAADGVAKQGKVHDLWHLNKRLEVAPVADVVVVEVQEPQLCQALETLA